MLLTSVCMAQSIQVSAPSRVEAGENFRVSYKVTTQDVDDFKSGLHSTDVVEVIAGPYTSSESSFRMVNGHTSSSSSVTTMPPSPVVMFLLAKKLNAAIRDSAPVFFP